MLLAFTNLLDELVKFFCEVFLSRAVNTRKLNVFRLVLPLRVLVVSVYTSNVRATVSHLATTRGISGGPDHRVSSCFIIKAMFSIIFSLMFS